MTRRILGAVLPLAVLEVGGLHQDPCTVPGIAEGARLAGRWLGISVS
jgi:hypothetical protein